jgi:hypothetical protein
MHNSVDVFLYRMLFFSALILLGHFNPLYSFLYCSKRDYPSSLLLGGTALYSSPYSSSLYAKSVTFLGRWCPQILSVVSDTRGEDPVSAFLIFSGDVCIDGSNVEPPFWKFGLFLICYFLYLLLRSHSQRSVPCWDMAMQDNSVCSSVSNLSTKRCVGEEGDRASD